MSFLLDPHDEKDKTILKKTFLKQTQYLLTNFYKKNEAALEFLRTEPLKNNYLNETASDERVSEVASTYNHPLHLLPSLGITNIVYRYIMKVDVPNFIPPPLRFIIMPAAWTIAAIDVFKTYSFARIAGLDDTTVFYETAGRAAYQVTNNFILPYTIFAATARAFRRTAMQTAGTYGGFALAIGASAALSGCVRNCIETITLNARLRRKDYSGGHLQTWGHLDSGFDNPIDSALASKYATEPTISNEHLELFPNFMVAEAAPAFEIPSETGNYVGHSPIEVNDSIINDTITNAQGLITRVPAPTPFTPGRELKSFAEYSLATPQELAVDERFGLVLPPAPLTEESMDHMIAQVRQIRLSHEKALAKYQH